VLTGAISFYALYPYWFSGYLFAVLLLLMPFDLLLGLPGMLTKRVALAAPNILEQGAEGNLQITTLQQKRQFPAKCIKLRVSVSRDGVLSRQRLICNAKRGSRYDMPIDTKHSGVTTFELKRIRTVSLIGLFALPVRVSRKVSTLILPAPVRPPHVTSLPRGVVFRPKPGGGFSEDYDLRPYRQGDQIRSVHWKISAKFDSLIIREPLVPPPHSRLIETVSWNGASERDLILGRLRWISDYLQKWELPYFLRIGSDGPVAEITQPADLTEYIYRYLEGTVRSLPAPAALPAYFAWVFKVDAAEVAEDAG